MVYPPILSERALGTPGGYDPEQRQFDGYNQPYHGNDTTNCWPTRAQGLFQIQNPTIITLDPTCPLNGKLFENKDVFIRNNRSTGQAMSEINYKHLSYIGAVAGEGAVVRAALGCAGKIFKLEKSSGN